MKRRSSELRAALSAIDRQHLRRTRRDVERFPDPANRTLLHLQGRDVIDFSSNDYLGLAHHPELVEAMAACAARCGAGSGAAHLITGHGIEHAHLEEELAAYTGRERALLFSTGYMANLALLSTLSGRHESVILDRLSHASLIDGALLSGARLRRFAHNDSGAAAQLLANSRHPVAILATEGVFSMDGDLAPLPELARLAHEYDAWLVVDDAHGLGVLGASGRGSLEHWSLESDAVPVLMGTLGKAFGAFGAFVAGCADLIELLLQRARPYIYTTALPQAVAAAARTALRIAQRESWRRERVLALAGLFRRSALQAGLQTGEALTPIQPLLLPDERSALAAQARLFDAGFAVAAIRPPTVPVGRSRLRITLSAAHTEEQVHALVGALADTLS
ncbi:MAG: 8-amino-7-oxononanoate synthase [Sinobacteraceae bacterium]|nr:8-amino-7-oxononanoate synthase [Nevskiaceae bacterium]